MIVVSHRGPYRFEPRRRRIVLHPPVGRRRRQRARRGARQGRRPARRGSRPPSPTSDVAATRARHARRDGHRPAPASTIDPELHALALRRRVERDAVVPVPRSVRPRAPARVRPPLPRGVGGLPRRERPRSPTRPRKPPSPARWCSSTTTSSRSRPRSCASSAADLRDRALHAHAVLRTRRRARAARRRRPKRSARALATDPAGFHSHPLGRAYQQSARAVLGRRAAIAPAVRRQPRSRRRRARRGAP